MNTINVSHTTRGPRGPRGLDVMSPYSASLLTTGTLAEARLPAPLANLSNDVKALLDDGTLDAFRTTLSVQTQAENDSRYLRQTGGTVTGTLSLTGQLLVFHTSSHFGYGAGGDVYTFFGYGRTIDGAAHLLFYNNAAYPNAENSAISRYAGANGNLAIVNTGTGGITLTPGAGGLKRDTYTIRDAGNTPDGSQALAEAGTDTSQRTWRATDLKDAVEAHAPATTPTAGDIIVARSPAAQVVANGTTTYTTAAEFKVTAAGTVRMRATHFSNADATTYMRFLKNGLAYAEWTIASTTPTERTYDMAVAVGDTLTVEVKATTGYTAYGKLAAISSGVACFCAVGG